MAKFNKPVSGVQTLPKRPTAPIRSVSTVPDAVTHERGTDFKQDTCSELFRLAVTNMVGENTFYESGKVRDRRFVSLIHKAVAEDPSWVARFVPYLRKDMFMRSASIVMAAEYAKAILDLQADSDRPRKGPKVRALLAEAPSIRSVIDSAIFRGDEPAEMIAYWHAAHGRKLPMGVKRGIADAATRLYHERNALKYDGTANTWRFGDVIELVRPRPKDESQSALFHYLIDRTHGTGEDVSALLEQLPRIAANKRLNALPTKDRRKFLNSPGAIEKLSEAGFTWESLSGWLADGKGMDAQAWESIIPSMGYMALLRNLRNFDEAPPGAGTPALGGISDAVANKVIAKLTDPEEVAKSMQFPFRFLSAYKEVPSDRWQHALGVALDLSTGNVPVLDGGTLILGDVSGSMTSGTLSKLGSVRPIDISVLFAMMVAKQWPNSRLVLFGTDSKEVTLTPGASILKQVKRNVNNHGLGHGTNTWQAVTRHYQGERRVICFTDMQSHYGSWSKPKGVSFYNVDLQGYELANAQSGSDGWYNFAGFSDKMFLALPLLENLKDATWPF